jgi:hypothetical protein
MLKFWHACLNVLKQTTFNVHSTAHQAIQNCKIHLIFNLNDFDIMYFEHNYSYGT